MARSEFQFWSGSAWVTATNQTFNAVIGFSITDRLNNPEYLELTLNNAASDPFGSTSGNQKGPFASGQMNELKEFQLCRVLDTDTGNILFYGKIYRLTDEFDMKYGQVLRIAAYDNLKELADYPTDDKTTGFALKNQKRSTVIKDIINNTSQIDSLRISADNITTVTANGFDDSVKTIANNETSGKVFLNVGKNRGLGGILEIAKADPHQASGAEKDFGYDYYTTDLFNLATSSGNHTPPQAFNYFKRGSRPATIESTKANFKGLRVEYPTSEFTETGIYRLMLMDYSFDRAGEELYTDAIINTTEKHANYDTSTGKTTHVEGRRHIRCELLNVNFGSGSDQVFQWEGKLISSNEKANLLSSEVSEIIQVSSGGSWRDIGRIQYQSARQGDGYIIVSYEVGESHDTNMDTYLPKTVTSALNIRGKVNNSSTCTITPSTGRMSNVHNLRRTYRINGQGVDEPSGLRRKVAAALTKSKTVSIKGGLRILRTPHTYIDTYADSIVLGQPRLPIDAEVYGFKVGMTIAKIDSAGTVTAYGYANAVSTTSGNTTITNTLNTGNWTSYTGSGNKIRIYMPVKAGHYIHVTNRLQNVEGYHFVNESIYSEGENIATTQFNTLSTQASDNTTIGIGLPPGAISSAIATSTAPIGDTVDKIAKAALGWTLIPDGTNNESPVMEVSDYNTITVAASTLSVGNGQYSYDISAQTIDVTTSHTMIYFDADVSLTTFQTALKHSYIPATDHILIGWAKASADTDAASRAILHLGMGAIGDDGVINVSTNNTNQQIDVTGVANDSITAAHLKASARPWASNLRWTGTAYNALKWDNGTNSTDATLEFGNGDAITITDGTTTGLSANTTHYFYISGSLANGQTRTVSNSTDYTVPLGDSVILLAIVTTGANATDGTAPNILPFNSKEPTLNAVSIAADSITADVIQADSITSNEIAVNNLQALSANMGSLSSGRGIFGVSTGNFNSGASGAGSGFTGIAMGEPGTGTNGIGNLFTLRAQNDGDDQVFIKEGKLYAGAGQVLIDAAGVTMGSDNGNTIALRFTETDPTGTLLFQLRSNPAETDIIQWTSNSGTGMDMGTMGIRNAGYLNTISSKYVKLPTDAAAVGDWIEVTGGDGSEGTPYTTKFQDKKLTFNTAESSGNLLTSAYGVFRYTDDANASGADTLGFYSGQTSASTSTSIDRSAFWVMESEAGYLRFEPNISYSGGNNNATIGLNNPLVYLRSVYVQAGAGTASYPSISFYGDPNTGFYRTVSDQIAVSLGGTYRYAFGSGYIKPIVDDWSDLGTISQRFDDVYATNGTINTSDARDKININPITLGLDFIKSLNPVSYKWKTKPEKQTHYGVLAQEVLETLKDFGIDSIQDFGGITGDEDTRYGARYAEFIPILIKAIQELSDKIKKLEGDK